jgi:ribosome-binding protein aMBF1 (putative translation factor)
MALSKKQQSRLESIIRQAELILKEAGTKDGRPASSRKSKKSAPQTQVTDGARRSRAAAADFRKQILAARKKGVSVAELAEKYGVTSSYIYQIR